MDHFHQTRQNAIEWYDIHFELKTIRHERTLFRENCVCGIQANRARMKENLYRSLMPVTALSPLIGYEKAAQVAQLASREELTLREACIRLGFLTGERFDEVFRPEEMA